MCLCRENSQKQTEKYFQTGGRAPGTQVLDSPLFYVHTCMCVWLLLGASVGIIREFFAILCKLSPDLGYWKFFKATLFWIISLKEFHIHMIHTASYSEHASYFGSQWYLNWPRMDCNMSIPISPGKQSNWSHMKRRPRRSVTTFLVSSLT